MPKIPGEDPWDFEPSVMDSQEFCLIEVRVTPRSSREKMEVCADGTFKVWVSAPPVEGEANAAVCQVIAKNLGIAKSRVNVSKGEKGRNKTFRIDGLNRLQIDEILAGGTK